MEQFFTNSKPCHYKCGDLEKFSRLVSYYKSAYSGWFSCSRIGVASTGRLEGHADKFTDILN